MGATQVRTPMIESLNDGPGIGSLQAIIIHCLQAPARAGIARELATGWYRTAASGASAHSMSDPAELIHTVPDDTQAWHCKWNVHSKGHEVSGYAEWSVDQWNRPEVLAALNNQAKAVAMDCIEHDIPPRWLSLQQLRDGVKGLATHNDVRVSGLSTTTHWDPGPNFPFAKFLAMVIAWIAKLSGTSTPPSGGGGSGGVIPVHQFPKGYGLPATRKTAHWTGGGSKPAWPLPGAYYFGPLEGPNASISGMYGDDAKWRPAIKLIQAAMEMYGWYHEGIDGLFKPGLQTAVQRFRERYDGPSGDLKKGATAFSIRTVDRRTWQAMPLRTLPKLP